MMADTAAEAVANARRFQNYRQAMCLRYVRAEAWQIGGLYGSAIDAWYGARHRHPGDRNPPLGAPMFYAGGRYGHIVINTGAWMRSTDCYLTGQVSEAPIDWPVTHWGQTYLGWTEDLNGVELPLGVVEEDEMTGKDWDKLRGIVAEEVARNNKAATDSVWAEGVEVTKPNGQAEDKSTRQLLRETWQRVAKMAL